MFSIIIPYYKKRSYIERCLDSVLNQTFQNFEIILVDDGSEDDLGELVAKRYLGKVKLIQQNNLGVSAARNIGIANAIYDYIAFLDADDCWSPIYLQYIREVISKESEIKIVGSGYSKNITNREAGESKLSYHIVIDYFKTQVFKNTWFTSSSSVINKDFFDNNPGFNLQIKRGEDLDVWFRAVASGGKAVYIENTLVYYSDEDMQQVTAKKYDFRYSILSVMADEYRKKDQPEVLRNFAAVFIRKRLYQYFFDSHNHQEAKVVLKKVGCGNLFCNLLYRLPIRLGRQISASKYISYYSKYLIG